MRALCPRTTPQNLVLSVFFLLKYSSAAERKYFSIYSFQVAYHPVRFFIYGYATLINIVLNGVLISISGSIGAAIATSLTMAMWNVCLSFLA